MFYPELYVSQTNVFGGLQKSFGKANYVILGVPFDGTSTYRTGARFGPDAIRKSSLNMENYSFRTGTGLEELNLHDLGDLHVSADTQKTLDRLKLVIKDLILADKTPVVIGGEHTITLGVLRGLGSKASRTALVSFDAHLDVREEFLGLRVSHATFMRRIKEGINPPKIFEVGTRAVCKEEIDYAKKIGIEFFTMSQIRDRGSQWIKRNLEDNLSNFESIYLSIDMDVLDPAYAPAVQNPEPEGMETSVLLDILHGICDKRLVGFDVVEIAPNFDQGVSAIQAAKVISETICYIGKSKR